jgi:hypothetical protein
LFLPILATLDVVVWYLRGTVFPAPCAYQTVTREWCRRTTIGEWHRCWQHRKRWARKVDGHQVDPNLRRWQVKNASGEVGDAADLTGRGFLSMRSRKETLFYYKGFARWPRDVFRRLPEVFKDHWKKARQRVDGLRTIGLRGLLMGTPAGTYVAVAGVLPSVILATRVVLLLSLVSLIAVIVAVAVPSVVAPPFEYVATYGFLAALAITRVGIWRGESRWRLRAAGDALKWILGLTALATLSGLIGLYSREIVDVLRAVVATAFTGVSALAVLYFYAVAIGRPGSRRVLRRQRRTRSRLRW